MTAYRTYEKPRPVGRRKEFPDRITLPLAEGVIARVDGLLADGEARLDLIRKAIEAEVERREKARRKARTQ